MKLEVIAKNIFDIYKINKSQADRIEFCKDLEVGGLTPSRFSIWLAAKISKVPVQIMIRPSASSFNYSVKDFEKMKKTARFVEKVSNINGVVFGILNDQNEIDEIRMQELVALLPSKQKTFHKAFDEVANKEQGIATLKELGIDHVLTSAGKNINENLDLLKKLTDLNQVTVLAGGGVNFDNIKNIIPACSEVHVGTAVRAENNWASKIVVAKINEMKMIVG